MKNPRLDKPLAAIQDKQILSERGLAILTVLGLVLTFGMALMWR
jgi:hypothetical protein